MVEKKVPPTGYWMKDDLNQKQDNKLMQCSKTILHGEILGRTEIWWLNFFPISEYYENIKCNSSYHMDHTVHRNHISSKAHSCRASHWQKCAWGMVSVTSTMEKSYQQKTNDFCKQIWKRTWMLSKFCSVWILSLVPFSQGYWRMDDNQLRHQSKILDSER